MKPLNRAVIFSCALALAHMVGPFVDGVLLPRARAADETSETQAGRRAAARVLFEEGVELLAAEKWAAAADRFERARALQSSARINYNLATALSKLGRYVYASELLRALELDPNVDVAVRDAARSRLAEIEKNVGGLVLVIEGDTSVVEIALDGRILERALLSVPIPVDPGEHFLVVRRDGREVVTRVIQVTEGQNQRVHVALPARALPTAEARPLPPAQSPTAGEVRTADPVLLDTASASPEPSTRKANRTWWWMGGGAAVALAIGVAAILLWPQDTSAVKGVHGTYRFD